jgi:hypothetical protein
MKEKQKQLLALPLEIYRFTVLVGGFRCQRNVTLSLRPLADLFGAEGADAV